MSANPLKAYLTKSGLISEEDFAKAEARAHKDQIGLMHALELMAIIPEPDLLDLFAKYFRVPKSNIGDMDIPGTIINLVPKDIALKYRVVPIDRAGNNLIVAMGDPRNLSATTAIRSVTGYLPKAVLASEVRITDALNKYYSSTFDIGIKHDASAAAAAASSSSKAKDVQRTDITSLSKEDGPVIKLVNQILLKCIETKASDIHIEPYETTFRVRLRIDGVLHEIVKPPITMKEPLIARVKIMSQLNIAEKRLPQDGAINISAGGRPIDFRVSSLPTVYGEKIVMRILDKSNLQVDMEKLGFETDELKKFKDSIHAPFGMVLVTGPTGSGKTTTLYSALAELNQVSDNIMTAEDPVEYNLEGINQTQMKPDIGLNFASALRAFLRQDPDIVMVGEIRDLETAEIGVKAALTGHMVLSTLHTNSAPDTISRLLNMGLESFNIVSALTCVTAQRLLRKICEKCRVVDESVTPQVMIELGIHPQYADRVKAYKGAGCPVCNGTGNKGRIAVHEVMKLNDPIREGILENLPTMKLKKVAMMNGMRSLRQSALNKMVKGLVNAVEVTASTAPDTEEGGSGSAAA